MFYMIPILITFIAALLITPFVIKLAKKFGFVDKPNERKVHEKVMPRLGGLAIFSSFMIGVMIFIPDTIEAWPLLVGATIITAIGIIDDKIELSAKAKFLGQIAAATVTVLGGVQIEYITVAGHMIEFGYFAIPLTILWIVGITNAINLIDGLDGLAAGVSSIALTTIGVIGIFMGIPLVALISFLLLGSTLGFLVFNFHPAKIFMGDTGSMFLGFMISVLAIMGLSKSVTLFSLTVPIIILAIPIIDTLFAIVRRFVNNQPISAPDKRHLHHCLMRLGFTHRQTVIIIYMMSILFSSAAILYTQATVLGSIVLLIGLLLLVELIVEVTGLIGENYRPILKFIDSRKKS